MPTPTIRITMYTTQWCPFCLRAEQLLKSKGVVSIEKIAVDTDANERTKMMIRTGRRTVPQIFIGERHVGGYDDLRTLEQSGELERWLAA